MKKSLLALAVLGAFAGAASAQSSVTIYGLLDVGVNHTDNGDVTTNRLKSGGQSGSRIGFKGTEDLGNGLSAVFVLENGINVDDGSDNTSAFSRLAYVGLNGGFGSVKFGRQISPLKASYEQIDPFGGAGDIGSVERIFFSHQAAANGGSANSFTGNSATASGQVGRTDNTINYTTANLSGFTGQVAYSFGEVAGDNSAGRRIGANIAYANGPLNVQFAYDTTDAGVVATTALTTTFDSKIGFLGATYNFGPFKLHGAYAETKIDPVVGTADRKYRDALLGVSIPVGAGTILASYIQHDNKDVSNADSKQYAIGYTYDLSKRTNIYTGYARTTNDDTVRLGQSAAIGVNNATLNGESISVINVGIRHKF